MKRGAPTAFTFPSKRPRPMRRSPAQIFHKRPAEPLYAPAKRMRIESPTTAPPRQMNDVFAELVQYVASLEQRIRALEAKACAPQYSEPFVRQPGIVVF